MGGTAFFLKQIFGGPKFYCDSLGALVINGCLATRATHQRPSGGRAAHLMCCRGGSMFERANGAQNAKVFFFPSPRVIIGSLVLFTRRTWVGPRPPSLNGGPPDHQHVLYGKAQKGGTTRLTHRSIMSNNKHGWLLLLHTLAKSDSNDDSTCIPMSTSSERRRQNVLLERMRYGTNGFHPNKFPHTKPAAIQLGRVNPFVIQRNVLDGQVNYFSLSKGCDGSRAICARL